MATVSPVLKQAVKDLPHVKEVHFTGTGAHYFHVHAFGSKNKQYGHLKLERTQVGTDGNNRPIFKQKHAENPATEIVETLTRAQVLKADTDAEDL